MIYFRPRLNLILFFPNSRVFVSDIAKNSPASVCGLRDGDHVIEVNGTNVETLTYETILGKIKLHMERHDLELLVLDKKSLRWYRERNYPITSRTIPTIVHIEPIINNINTEIQTKSVDIVGEIFSFNVFCVYSIV